MKVIKNSLIYVSRILTNVEIMTPEEFERIQGANSKKRILKNTNYRYPMTLFNKMVNNQCFIFALRYDRMVLFLKIVFEKFSGFLSSVIYRTGRAFAVDINLSCFLFKQNAQD
jgi:hypothetical protein